jgi:hypothetical protein
MNRGYQVLSRGSSPIAKKLAYAALFDEHIDMCPGEALARRLGGIGHKGGPELEPILSRS